MRFIPVNIDVHNFSGLFRTGADYGLIRYSDVFKPNIEHPKTQAGCALKFFRDGLHSGNTVLMTSFNTVDSFNFFKQPFSSILDFPKNKCAQATIFPKMATVDRLAMGNSSLDLARHHADSAMRVMYEDEVVKQPFRLRMVHHPELHDLFPDSFVMESIE